MYNPGRSKSANGPDTRLAILWLAPRWRWCPGLAGRVWAKEDGGRSSIADQSQSELTCLFNRLRKPLWKPRMSCGNCEADQQQEEMQWAKRSVVLVENCYPPRMRRQWEGCGVGGAAGVVGGGWNSCKYHPALLQMQTLPEKSRNLRPKVKCLSAFIYQINSLLFSLSFSLL